MSNATLDLRSSTEWPSFHQPQDTPSASQPKMKSEQGTRLYILAYFLNGAHPYVRLYMTVSSIRCLHLCAHVCLSLTLSLSPVSFSPFLPVLCLSLPFPVSSVKWWTCSPHAVCHCHPSLQSWRWQGWPGCVWSGWGLLALQRRMTSTIYWRWRRKAR